jgi:hypothetical protein
MPILHSSYEALGVVKHFPCHTTLGIFRQSPGKVSLNRRELGVRCGKNLL